MAWWVERAEAGMEGMVVKPLDFVARKPGGWAQPAIKVRGREYLRIIYGPEYLLPEHLQRLHERIAEIERIRQEFGSCAIPDNADDDPTPPYRPALLRLSHHA